MQKRLTDQQKIDICNEYIGNLGSTCVSLGKKYGVTGGSISSILKTRGIETRKNRSHLMRKYHVNDYCLDEINTEAKAYFLGFMYADGFNNPLIGKMVIGLQERDKEILDKFKNLLEYEGPLLFRPKKKNTHQNQWVLTVNNTYLSKRLNSLGCVKKKSLILKFPTDEQIPSHLIKHFIRGYFDGDGCICPHRKKKERTNISIAVSLVATKWFCESLKKILISNLDINPSIYEQKCWKKNGITRYLHIGSSENSVLKFLSWIYDDATIFLRRKFNQYQEVKDIYNAKKV